MPTKIAAGVAATAAGNPEPVLSRIFGPVRASVRSSYPDPIGRRLLRTTGGLVAIAGICAYDSDRQRTAQTHFHQALRLAKASGDQPFGAYVMALLDTQALHTQDVRTAATFATVGLRVAGPRISPALEADLYAQRAKAHARMNDIRLAHEDMDRAQAAAQRIRPAQEPPETGYVQPGLVETQIGAALLSLGDLRPAMTYAEQATRTAAHPRGRVNRLVTVTLIAMAARDFDRAAEAATTMVELAEGMESARLRERFRTIRTSMTRHRSSAVLRHIVDRLDAELALPL